MTEKNQVAGLCHNVKNTQEEKTLVGNLSAAFNSSTLALPLKLQHFVRHVRRKDIACLIAKYEIFKLSFPVKGSIVDWGVFAGGGVMTWLHFSSIFEPYNHSIVQKFLGKRLSC